jgi:hypothetical protein
MFPGGVTRWFRRRRVGKRCGAYLKSFLICCVWIAPSGSTPAAYHDAYGHEITADVAEAILRRSVAILLHLRTRAPK